MIARRLVAALVALASCSGPNDDTGPSTTGTKVASLPSAPGIAFDPTPDSAGATTPGATEVLRPGLVPFDGSVESLVLEFADARNFATGVQEWLDAVPGQEGVLRNSRGITLFVPVDDGFTDDDRDEWFADPDVAAATIGEHLHVGALVELEGSVTVATGTEYQIGDDGTTIGDRR